MTAKGAIKEKWQREFSIPNLMWRQISLMKINAQWPIEFRKYLPKHLSFLSAPLQVLYSMFWPFLAFHIAILFVVALVMNLQNDDSTIPEITNAFIQSVIYLYSFFVTVHFQWYHKDLAKMVDFMVENFKMRSARGLTYVTTEPCYKVAKLFTVVYILSCLAGVIHFSFLPIYLQVWELPLACWYPFDYYPRPTFVFVYISQCLGQIQVALSFGSSDFILASLTLLILGQYDILFCSLKNVRYTAIMLNGLTKHRAELVNVQSKINLDDEEANQFYYSFERKEDLDDDENLTMVLKHMKMKLDENRSNGKRVDSFLAEYQAELAFTLRECIIHHQNLVNVCGMLERFYNPIVLVKSLQVTLQICNLAYVATRTTSSLLQNINYLEYLFLTLLDILIFGYCGNWIKEQSIRVGDAALRCPWHLCGGSFRRDLLIILANTVKPIKLTGGKFFILDYTKVSAIVKASFSFYTLLQNMS